MTLLDKNIARLGGLKILVEKFHPTMKHLGREMLSSHSERQLKFIRPQGLQGLTANYSSLRTNCGLAILCRKYRYKYNYKYKYKYIIVQQTEKSVSSW